MSIVEDFISKICPDFMKLVIYPTFPREFSQDLSGTLKVVFISFFYLDCLWSHASLDSDVFPQTVVCSLTMIHAFFLAPSLMVLRDMHISFSLLFMSRLANQIEIFILSKSLNISSTILLISLTTPILIVRKKFCF